MIFAIGQDKIHVTGETRAEFLARFGQMLRNGVGVAVATINLDHLVKLHEDPHFRAAYGAHDIIVADGNPIVWLSRLAGRPVALMPGSDLIEPVCAMAADLGIAIAFIGSTQPVLDKAADSLQSRHPNLRVAAKLAPPMGFDPESAQAAALLQQAQASGAQLCLLALGAPKQERLAMVGRRVCPQMGFLSIGAGLDFLAGAQMRAPYLVRLFAMEWLWRMLGNPRRLAGRYLKCAIILPRHALNALRLRRAGGKT
ncbi:WecB/TagA/CpsF family glycosyltransferase [Roseinatronobacter sp.]